MSKPKVIQMNKVLGKDAYGREIKVGSLVDEFSKGYVGRYIVIGETLNGNYRLLGLTTNKSPYTTWVPKDNIVEAPNVPLNSLHLNAYLTVYGCHKADYLRKHTKSLGFTVED